MENIGAVLKGQGLGFGDLVKCTVMLDDMADWPAFNKVYVTYFPDGKYPARSAFGADGLALGALSRSSASRTSAEAEKTAAPVARPPF